MDSKQPLVSLIVISYNSSQFIMEALESIKNQTYANIELIVSDDCSTDNTRDISEKWIEKNSGRFVNSRLIKLKTNAGISANCNAGANACSGEWMMITGADDVLLPNCVKDNIHFIVQNQNARIVHSISGSYRNHFTGENLVSLRDYSGHIISHPLITAAQQYRVLLRGCLINPTTTFIERKLWEEVGRYDESIRNIDDWPMWLKITGSGCRIYFMNRITANYRIHHSSVANERINGNLFNHHYQRERSIYKKYILKNISGIERFFIHYEYYRIVFLRTLHLDKNTFFNRALSHILSRPSVWFRKINRKVVFNRIKKEIRKAEIKSKSIEEK